MPQAVQPMWMLPQAMPQAAQPDYESILGYRPGMELKLTTSPLPLYKLATVRVEERIGIIMPALDAMSTCDPESEAAQHHRMGGDEGDAQHEDHIFSRLH